MKYSKGLETIFTSNFYIDAQYAMSFAPTMIRILSGDSIHYDESPEERLMNEMSESVVSGTDKYVAVLSIKQPILKYTYWDYVGTVSYMRILDMLAQDPAVMGVVLDIDSGGGQVYGTPAFYDYLMAYPKPIGTFADEYLCSAAYYIGNGTRFIVAAKRAAAIGSIGAYAHWLDFTSMMEKWGAKSHLMYATESTEKNYEVRKIMEEDDPKPYIKNILDPIVKTFQTDMKAARPQLDEKVFKGGTWGAEESLNLGLVDEIGTIETAISMVVELANKSNFNNSNKTGMSQEKSFPRIAAVLGLDNVEAKKAHVFSSTETFSLSADQLERLETALSDPGDASKVATLTQQLNEANAAKQAAETRATIAEQNLTEANGKINAINTAIDSAVEKAGLSAEKKATHAENVDFLADKVVEYGSEDGAELTGIHSEGDKNSKGGDTTSIWDSLVS